MGKLEVRAGPPGAIWRLKSTVISNHCNDIYRKQYRTSYLVGYLDFWWRICLANWFCSPLGWVTEVKSVCAGRSI